MKSLFAIIRMTAMLFFVVVAHSFALMGCASIPKESVELSTTVGRDLREVHRAHRALANLHYSRIEAEVNQFVDEVYRPKFIEVFAREFDLNGKVKLILDNRPNDLLVVLTQFVKIATERVEKKRAELLSPILAQKASVIEDIDAAHQQIQAAQSIVTGHLASVRKVRQVQDELLEKVGLKGVREKITRHTAELSNKVEEFVKNGRDISNTIDSTKLNVTEFDSIIGDLKKTLSRTGNQ